MKAPSVPLALMALLAAADASAQSFPTIDERLEPLRSRFESDAGKVRGVFLVSPT